MDEDKHQKELFEFDEPRKPFSKLSALFPKPDIEGKIAVVLTLDKMVFIAMGIVMVMVLVFALGVETGKRRAQARPQAAGPARAEAQNPTPAQAAARTPPPAISTAQAVTGGPAAAGQRAFFNTSPAMTMAAGDAMNSPAAKPGQARGASKPYTIVAAAFSKRDTAQAGVELLKKDGFVAYVYFSSPYYLVCTGGYDDRNGPSAQRDLRTIRRTFKDAYVKPR